MATHITRRAITSSVMAGAAAIPASSLPAVALTSKIIRCGNRQGAYTVLFAIALGILTEISYSVRAQRGT